MFCYHCGAEIEIEERVFRQQECPQCNVYLHCCLNCKYFDELAYHQCREDQADYVQDKKMANFCGYFKPGEKPNVIQKNKSDEARQKLEALFNNPKGGDDNDA